MVIWKVGRTKPHLHQSVANKNHHCCSLSSCGWLQLWLHHKIEKKKALGVVGCGGECGICECRL